MLALEPHADLCLSSSKQLEMKSERRAARVACILDIIDTDVN
jgi:hypothetical protein